MNTDRFKFRLWCKETKKYYQDEEFCINATGSIVIQTEFEETPWFEDDFIIEQCTGLRDKNGNLIYEGDIVVVPNTYPFYDYKDGIPHNDLNSTYGRIEHDAELNYIGIIEYDDEDAKFCLVLECVNPRKRGISSGIAEGLSEYEELEIIGNIHDEKWEKI